LNFGIGETVVMSNYSELHEKDWYEQSFNVDFLHEQFIDSTIYAINNTMNDVEIDNEYFMSRIRRYSKELIYKLKVSSHDKVLLRRIDLLFIHECIKSLITKYSDENTGFCNLSWLTQTSLQGVYYLANDFCENVDVTKELVRYIQCFFVQSSDLID
jgi:hypothetical protein